MTPIDIRARINRRALECPDATSFPGAGPVGHDCGVTTVIERMVTSKRTSGTVIYLANASTPRRRDRVKD